MMHEGAHDVHVCVAVGDHHPFRPGSRTAGIIDGQEIALANLDFGKVRRMCCQGALVINPRLARTFQRHEMLNTWQLLSNTVDSFDIVRMRADNSRSAMVDDVFEIFR